MSINLASVLLRFALGGSAVVLATIVSRRFGGHIGGVFAAFPAVYLAAVLSLGLEYRGQELLIISQHLSQGALAGMLADVICALAASRFILKRGWKKGLVYTLLLWCIAAPALYFTWQIMK